MQSSTSGSALVRSLYEGVLSGTSSPELRGRVMQLLAPTWQSIGDYSGAGKSRDQFAAQLEGFGKLIPDLKWEVVELIEAGDRYVVRGRASGTPVGPLFGVAPTGKRFEIMSVDIHTVADGQVARTYHVEDWAGALRQLAPK